MNWMVYINCNHNQMTIKNNRMHVDKLRKLPTLPGTFPNSDKDLSMGSLGTLAQFLMAMGQRTCTAFLASVDGRQHNSSMTLWRSGGNLPAPRTTTSYAHTPLLLLYLLRTYFAGKVATIFIAGHFCCGEEL